MSVLVSCYEEIQQGMGQVLMLTINMIPNKLEEFKKLCCVFWLSCLFRLKITLLTWVCYFRFTLVQVRRKCDSVFRRSFHVRSLTKVKEGRIRKFLNNKVVKPNYLLVLFSVFYQQAETKIVISPNSFLSLRFGENTSLCCETWDSSVLLVQIVYSYVKGRK